MDGYQIKLVAGDWSGDGHSLTEDLMILSNITATEFTEAIKAGLEKVGVPLDDSKDHPPYFIKAAHDYDDDFMPEEWAEKLGMKKNTLGYDDDNYRIEGYAESNPGEYSNNWFGIHLKLAELGNPDFRYIIPVYGTVHIGGYGLYSM